MRVLIGVDGYRRGWVAVIHIDGALHWRTGPVGAIDAVIDGASIAAIDIPIGLTDHGWRECDAAAKALLGHAGSRVFMTPPRAVVELGLAAPNDQVQEVSRRLTGQGVSRQALGLAARILDVDRLMPDARIIEVHPELSFLQMTGGVLDSKKSTTGVAQRIEALSAWEPDVTAALARCPSDVPMDDALDALAALWSAHRWATGVATVLPGIAALDPRGVPMRIVT